jgi:hypothetical protein
MAGSQDPALCVLGRAAKYLLLDRDFCEPTLST